MTGLLSFLIAVAYWPGIMSAAVAPRWALITVGCCVALALTKTSAARSFSLGHLFGAAFVLYAGASIMWSVLPADSIGAFVNLLGLAAAFVLGSRTKDFTPVCLALALSGWVLFLSYFVLNDSWVIGEYGNGGIFLNRDFAGGFAAVATIAALYGLRSLYLARWARLALLLGPLAALIDSRCYGAVLATMATVAIAESLHLSLKRRVLYGAFLLVLVGSGLAVAFQIDPHKVSNTVQRFLKWDYVTANLSWFGHGFYTMGAAFPFSSSDNDLVDLLWDFGIGSVPLIALVIYALRSGTTLSARWVLLVIVLDGFPSSPLRLPATAYVAALALGHVCGYSRRLLRVGPAFGVAR